jgi:hypothetical protein
MTTATTASAGKIGIVSGIIDLLMIGEHRQKARIEKVIKPVLDFILVTHCDYIDVLHYCERVLPTRKSGDGYFFVDVLKEDKTIPYMSYISCNDPYIENILMHVEEKLVSESLDIDAIRAFVGANSHELFNMLEDIDEKRFIWTVINYFLQQESPAASFEDIDKTVAVIEKYGNDSTLTTHDSSLLSCVKNTNDPIAVRQTITSRKLEMLLYLNAVANTYTAILRKVA